MSPYGPPAFGERAEGDDAHVRAYARTLAARDAEAADVADPVVLLSPACASFDQYRNFEARGVAFRELVLALPGVRAEDVRTREELQRHTRGRASTETDTH